MDDQGNTFDDAGMARAVASIRFTENFQQPKPESRPETVYPNFRDLICVFKAQETIIRDGQADGIKQWRENWTSDWEDDPTWYDNDWSVKLECPTLTDGKVYPEGTICYAFCYRPNGNAWLVFHAEGCPVSE